MRATSRRRPAKSVSGYVPPPLVGVWASWVRRPAALVCAWRAWAVIGSAPASGVPSVAYASSMGVFTRSSHTPGLSKVYEVGDAAAATATDEVASAGER